MRSRREEEKEEGIINAKRSTLKMRGGASEKERDGQREREARLMEVAQPPPRPFKHIEYLEGLQVVTLKLKKGNLSLSLPPSL